MNANFISSASLTACPDLVTYIPPHGCFSRSDLANPDLLFHVFEKHGSSTWVWEGLTHLTFNISQQRILSRNGPRGGAIMLPWEGPVMSSSDSSLADILWPLEVTWYQNTAAVGVTSSHANTPSGRSLVSMTANLRWAADAQAWPTCEIMWHSNAGPNPVFFWFYLKNNPLVSCLRKANTVLHLLRMSVTENNFGFPYLLLYFLFLIILFLRFVLTLRTIKGSKICCRYSGWEFYLEPNDFNLGWSHFHSFPSLLIPLVTCCCGWWEDNLVEMFNNDVPVHEYDMTFGEDSCPFHSLDKNTIIFANHFLHFWLL